MAKQSLKEELGRVLPDNIRLLSKVIARKPTEYSPEWASSVNEAFSLYTNTSTIDLLTCLNRNLIEWDWPFPSFLDLKSEIETGLKSVLRSRSRKLLPRWRCKPNFIFIPLLGYGSDLEQHERNKVVDLGMIYLFKKYQKRVFKNFAATSLLTGKETIIKDIKESYKRGLWSACIVSVMPLLDFIMRGYLGTKRLEQNVQVLRNAFVEHAGLGSKDLMPGSIAVGEGRRNPNTGNTFAKTIEEDLRLPGIYLASFFEFADRYYCWYKSSDMPHNTNLNRHAVMHGASECWTEANAVRILSFLHLMVYLEVPLKVLIHGKAALPEIMRLRLGLCNGTDLSV